MMRQTSAEIIRRVEIHGEGGNVPAMNILTTVAPILAVLSCSVPAFAQLELPRPSPNAKLVQTVGLTDITVEYSSPAVRGRQGKIWGTLVPYGQIWRAGANGATKITFSKDVTIGTTTVPAGSYALFLIPAATGNWTVVVSKEANQPGSSAYKKEQDLLRLDVKPEVAPMRERLTFLFSDFTNDTAKLQLEWEKIRVSIPVKLGTEAQVAANLTAYQDTGAQGPYTNAARYELEQKKDYDAGLGFVEKSIAIKEDWLNVWTKAQLLAAKGKTADAYPLAQKAQTLGEKATRFFFADEVKKALVDWKPKAK